MLSEEILRTSQADAQESKPEAGRLSALSWKRGSMELRYYRPPHPDPQTPHGQDELYVVIAGSARFVCDRRAVDCVAHDVLFAAAGAVHRFERPSADFAVWVIFYGAQGGERAAQSG